MEGILEYFSVLIEKNIYLAPLLSFFSGILVSLTPCSLSSVPLIIAYVGGIERKNVRNAFFLSVFFAIGSSITFVLLGILASILGVLINNASKYWYIFLSFIMFLMALQTFEIYNFIPQSSFLLKNKKKGFVGAFIAGVLSSLFASPCATPVLIVLMGLLANKSNVLWGILLMVCYSIGYSIITIIAGTSLVFVRNLNSNNKYGNFTVFLKYFLGCVIILIALCLFNLGVRIF